MVNVIQACTQIYSSPQARCQLMAERYSVGREVIYDQRLKEFNFGLWEGRAWSEISRFDIDRWCSDIAEFCPPEGESFRMLIARVGQWLSEVFQLGGGNCVAFTHAGVIKALRVLLLNESPEQAAIYQVPYHQIEGFELR